MPSLPIEKVGTPKCSPHNTKYDTQNSVTYTVYSGGRWRRSPNDVAYQLVRSAVFTTNSDFVVVADIARLSLLLSSPVVYVTPCVRGRSCLWTAPAAAS